MPGSPATWTAAGRWPRRGWRSCEDPATEGYLRYLLTEISLFQGRIDEAGALIAQVTALRPTVPVAGMAELIGPLLCIHRGEAAAAVDRARAQVAAGGAGR